MARISVADASWRLSLPALAVFEAAGRHLNFSRAARELATSQPSVSHHISWLEADLGCTLFRRLHRGVSLTAEGRILFEAVTRSRRAIEQAQTDIGAHAERKLINIATDFGFAGEWLIPQLAALAAVLPDVEVRISASQAVLDSGAELADFTIMLGDGNWHGCRSTLLFPETVFAVASPRFLAKHGKIADAGDLARHRLLHLESRDHRPWLTWAGWFAAHDVTRSPRDGDCYFNTYSLVQQAAIAGQGVALGWHPLIEAAVKARLLVAAVAAPVSTALGYYLIEDGQHPQPRRFDHFRTWLIGACAKRPGALPPDPR